jgi:L-iditol 2-dehydrogenase
MDIPNKMKAAVMHGVFNIRMEDISVPSIEVDEVLVKIMAVGVCGSDVHYYEHGRISTYVVERPMILGHECAGIVVATGVRAKKFKPGDRVAIEPGVTCGRCEACKGGRYNLCGDVRFLATPPYDGAFVQYIKHREDFLFPIPDHMSFEEATLVEPFSVGIHAVKKARLQPGSSVAIMGMGPVGLMTILAAKFSGAKEIIVSDVIPMRLEAAKMLGATHTINARDCNTVDEILKIRNSGVDAAFETAGNLKALQDAVNVTCSGGKVCVVGLPPQEEVPLHIPTISIKELEIYGVFRYANTYAQGISLLSSGFTEACKLITHRYPLVETKEAMEMARTNKMECLKVIVNPN